MKPPKSIDVFGKKVPIKTVKHLEDEEGHELEGCFYAKEFKIDIVVCSHQTLLHELCHALFERVGLNQANLSPELNELLSENIATFITETYDLRFKRKK